jgi:hypothetical protein
MCICFVNSFAATDLYPQETNIRVSEIRKIETSKYRIYLYQTEVCLYTLQVLYWFTHYRY